MKLDLSILMNKVDKVFPFNGKLVDYDLNDNLNTIKVVNPIKYEGKIVRIEDSLHLDVKISYSYETKCSRCLKSVKANMETSLSGAIEEKEKSYEDDIEEEIINEIINYDIPIYCSSSGLIDIDEYILMGVDSSLPMKTLCDDNCKGLCNVCGIDLNIESCDCDKDFIDPRFEKLKNLVIED